MKRQSPRRSFTFPAFTLLPGRAVVVFGGGTVSGAYGGAKAFTTASGAFPLASTSYLQLIASGVEVDRLAYNGTGTDNVALNANTLGKSINRAPDATGTSFAAHDAPAVGGVGPFSPGARPDGSWR